MGITRVFSFAAIWLLCIESSLLAQELIENQCFQEAHLGHVTVAYDKYTGEVRFNTYNRQQIRLHSFVLEINPENTDWRFTVGEDPDGDRFHDGCAFDKEFFNVCSPTRIAVIDVNGMAAWPSAFSFGNVAEPGMDFEFIKTTWLISGTHSEGLDAFQWESTTGFWGPCLFVVPEPFAVVLLRLGFLALIGLSRRP